MKTSLNKEIPELSSMGASQKERSQAAKILGKLGGEASVKKRFSGLSKEQISQQMKMVRMVKSALAAARAIK